VDPSPALIIHFSAGVTAQSRDRLVSRLAEHGLIAIQEDRLEDPQVWTAHFDSLLARDRAAGALASDPEFSALALQAVEVEDEDWARRTQADLPAITIGRVTVAPPWDLPSNTGPHRESILVLIEPSRGFGTGHHQSTRLCLALLQNRSLSGLRVTDIGTGSGVLAITAAKLGAAFVAAIDSDPDAIENARENIAANEVETTVDAHVDDLISTTTAPADLVLANLTGTLLSQHAKDLVRLVRPGGLLIVSGFNVDERDRVTDALAGSFEITETAEEDDWHAFVLRRL
jgi:ribosomal protein L11 methyltransferase